ncbi:PREDICTED: 28S ribosomal protein S6, mitochondrial [Pterocles gutturalis]|uniref:28S ribosomal protein S6, mitochondrial n=1 Tax=Pterocles gutturalis TaxID=240206 RepID=UPI0005289802|nr:PREDICTED: 28S ribosomal protein S6, mitochondrial [Pterocles gutturalis]
MSYIDHLESAFGGSLISPCFLRKMKEKFHTLEQGLHCEILPETAAVLKRTVEALMERGAIVRNLENLGERSLPYKISKHKERHRRGGYFLIDLEAPPSIVSTMMDHLGRDIDVIRRGFIKHPVSKTEECSGIVPVSYEDKLTAKKK